MMTTGQSAPSVAKYRARPVAVDGYRDLAVVQIYATTDGKPVSPGSLHLPYYTIGNVAKLQLDQPLTVLGYPSVADSQSVTVTSGVLSTFVPDPQGHIKGSRFELETTARVAHGNSGGSAIDSAGHLVGVPTKVIPGEQSDTSWRLRSIALAAPLIAAARSHTAYHSNDLVQLTGSESVTAIGIGATKAEACGGSQTTASSDSAVFSFKYSGFTKGTDVALLIVAPDGTPVREENGQSYPHGPLDDGSDCIGLTVGAAAVGASTMPTGTWHVQMFAGPSLKPVSPEVALTVTAPAGSGSSTGAGN
jgi:putative serine protease PepD